MVCKEREQSAMGFVVDVCATKCSLGIMRTELDCCQVIVELCPSIESFTLLCFCFVSCTFHLYNPLLVFLHDLAHVWVFGNVSEIDGHGAIRWWWSTHCRSTARSLWRASASRYASESRLVSWTLEWCPWERQPMTQSQYFERMRTSVHHGYGRRNEITSLIQWLKNVLYHIIPNVTPLLQSILTLSIPLPVVQLDIEFDKMTDRKLPSINFDESDHLPFPSWHLCPWHDQQRLWGAQGIWILLILSKGYKGTNVLYWWSTSSGFK